MLHPPPSQHLEGLHPSPALCLGDRPVQAASSRSGTDRVRGAWEGGHSVPWPHPASGRGHSSSRKAGGQPVPWLFRSGNGFPWLLAPGCVAFPMPVTLLNYAIYSLLGPWPAQGGNKIKTGKRGKNTNKRETSKLQKTMHNCVLANLKSSTNGLFSEKYR